MKVYNFYKHKSLISWMHEDKGNRQIRLSKVKWIHIIIRKNIQGKYIINCNSIKYAYCNTFQSEYWLKGRACLNVMNWSTFQITSSWNTCTHSAHWMKCSQLHVLTLHKQPDVLAPLCSPPPPPPPCVHVCYVHQCLWELLDVKRHS